MVKKLLALSLLPVCAYAADKEPYSPLVEYMRECENEKTYGGRIWPSSFNDYGKKVFAFNVKMWVDAVKEGNLPADQGLAKIFVDMDSEGAEKVINDVDALKKTNSYLNDYEVSVSAEIEAKIKCRVPGKGGNYCFSGAENANVDDLRSIRQHELYNITYKRHEAPIMPKEGLVGWYYNLRTTSELELLKLNQDNTSLSPAAIRGAFLFNVYKLQQDKTDTEL